MDCAYIINLFDSRIIDRYVKFDYRSDNHYVVEMKPRTLIARSHSRMLKIVRAAAKLEVPCSVNHIYPYGRDGFRLDSTIYSAVEPPWGEDTQNFKIRFDHSPTFGGIP